MSASPESLALGGVKVVVFEARMAGTMADMITRHGGIVLAAPALREIPLGESPEVATFAETLEAGGFDVVIFETGVGVRYLAQSIETRMPRETWVKSLGQTRIVARGPKPTAALRELGAQVDFQVPSPNTWHETLGLLDEQLPVEGLRVAVQEYGAPNAELVEGLEARGATVTRVPVYRWALPEDPGPLRAAIAEIAAGRVGIALFTSSQQIEHLLSVAHEEGREADLRAGMAKHTVVGSIGPTTSETLRLRGLPVDIEPVHPKLGHLIAAVAAGWRAVGKSAIP